MLFISIITISIHKHHHHHHYRIVIVLVSKATHTNEIIRRNLRFKLNEVHYKSHSVIIIEIRFQIFTEFLIETSFRILLFEPYKHSLWHNLIRKRNFNIILIVKFNRTFKTERKREVCGYTYYIHTVKMALIKLKLK